MSKWCNWFTMFLIFLIILEINVSCALSSSSYSSSIPSQQNQQQHHHADRRVGHSWEIHKTIRELEEFGMPSSTYDAMTFAVLNVLRKWQSNILDDNAHETIRNENTTTIVTAWQSLLNKANLRHEVEESIVALHHLHEWSSEQRHKHSSSSSSSSSLSSFRFMAVDACCGKGVFSTLLTYLAPEYYPDLDRIVLLDKDSKINWNHIAAANENYSKEQRPYLELWATTNLHDYDILLDRFLALDHPLAVTGIHLCKTLSPTLIGLINGLGKERAPYLCLAPCCLPRISQKITMAQYESPLQRNARRQAQQEQQQRRRKQQESFKCYVCRGNHHVRNCPQQHEYTSIHVWNSVVSTALLQVPCRICGEVGHRPANCNKTTQEPSAKQQEAQHQGGTTTVLRHPPKVHSLDSMMKTVAESQTPFETYCDLLSLTIQNKQSVRVIDSGLTSLHSMSLPTKKEQFNDKNKNWNQNRKSIYIVVTR